MHPSSFPGQYFKLIKRTILTSRITPNSQFCFSCGDNKIKFFNRLDEINLHSLWVIHYFYNPVLFIINKMANAKYVFQLVFSIEDIFQYLLDIFLLSNF